MLNEESFGKPAKHELGLKAQFWGEQKVNFSNEQEQAFYNYLDKIIEFTNKHLSKEFKQTIIDNAKEVICWKCIKDKDFSGLFEFVGFPLESSGGLMRINPVFLFVQNNILYSYDSSQYNVAYSKFSNRLNYESFIVMMNIIQDTSDIGFAIAPSNDIKCYIEDKQYVSKKE